VGGWGYTNHLRSGPTGLKSLSDFEVAGCRKLSALVKMGRIENGCDLIAPVIELCHSHWTSLYGRIRASVRARVFFASAINPHKKSAHIAVWPN
jgi:hypothetical protein